MTINTARSKKLLVIPVALAATAMLTLSACGSSDPAADTKPAVQDKLTEDRQETPEPSIKSIPVGEPFGDAVWAINGLHVPSGVRSAIINGKPVKTRGDRLIIETIELDDKRGVLVFDSDGKEVWQRSFDPLAEISVLQEVVAVMEYDTVESGGLDKAEDVGTLTLLSLKDGSTVAELSQQDPIHHLFNEFGQIVLNESVVTEDGKVHEQTKAPEFGALFLKDGVTAPVELDASIPELEDAFDVETRVIAPALGIAVVGITHGPSPEFTYYAVKTKDGSVVNKLDCGDALFAKHTDSSTNVAYASPNGDYAVLESFWISSSEAKCYTEQEDVKGAILTAVDDNGTAYGTTSDSKRELVVITAEGTARVSALPNQASAPIGILDGGIAIHTDSLGKVTGNPIK